MVRPSQWCAMAISTIDPLAPVPLNPATPKTAACRSGALSCENAEFTGGKFHAFRGGRGECQSGEPRRGEEANSAAGKVVLRHNGYRGAIRSPHQP